MQTSTEYPLTLFTSNSNVEVAFLLKLNTPVTLYADTSMRADVHCSNFKSNQYRFTTHAKIRIY